MEDFMKNEKKVPKTESVEEWLAKGNEIKKVDFTHAYRKFSFSRDSEKNKIKPTKPFDQSIVNRKGYKLSEPA